METIRERNHEIIGGVQKAIEAKTGRSCWQRGVLEYTAELLQALEENIDYIKTRVGDPVQLDTISTGEFETLLQNGAGNWDRYSYGGCSLIYDSDIAARLCTPSELKRNHGGDREPNQSENWLDVQTRALYQAARILRYEFRQTTKK